MTVTNLDLFYETRTSLYVNPTSPTNSANTDLKETPKAAEIRFEDSPNRFVDAENFEAPNEKGFETARFLIERAMHDPEATVVPANT